MLDFVVEFEHPPGLCPHSNAMVRKAFEDAVEGGALDALARGTCPTGTADARCCFRRSPLPF